MILLCMMRIFILLSTISCSMRIGVIGLGMMGSHIAIRLLNTGHKINVYNRSIEKANPFVKRSEEHTSELQSRQYLVCRLLLEKKKKMLMLLLPVPPPITLA